MIGGLTCNRCAENAANFTTGCQSKNLSLKPGSRFLVIFMIDEDRFYGTSIKDRRESNTDFQTIFHVLFPTHDLFAPIRNNYGIVFVVILKYLDDCKKLKTM